MSGQDPRGALERFLAALAVDSRTKLGLQLVEAASEFSRTEGGAAGRGDPALYPVEAVEFFMVSAYRAAIEAFGAEAVQQAVANLGQRRRGSGR